ncbi:SDR family oxidoreductase [Kluyvera cryocrescens]|uniref:SDR family oxidoreductase n=1 Tax=Kluyvera cryocrescens TaxID=580 RepID=UPI003D7FF1DC
MTLALVTGASRGLDGQRRYSWRRKAIRWRLIIIRTRRRRMRWLTLFRRRGKAFAVQADIGDEQQVEAMFNLLDKRPEPLTALVNNAGILFTQSRVEALSAERINRVLTTNVTGYFLCCREAVKRMAVPHGGAGGAIVNVSSAASRLGAPFEYVDYAASKGAVDTLTTGLALEVAAQGIRVNCVRPGLIYTEMHASGGEPGRVDRVKSMLPMQRGGQPEEVAQAIVWLLSEKASYVTGSFIELAGGK